MNYNLDLEYLQRRLMFSTDIFEVERLKKQISLLEEQNKRLSEYKSEKQDNSPQGSRMGYGGK